MESGSDGLKLALDRVIPAAPAAVFAAFNDPEKLARWWGPSGFEIPIVDFDPRVGETYRIEMQPPEGDAFHLSGEFLEVVPPARLSFTFAWEHPDPDDVANVATLLLRDFGESTEVVLTQSPFRTEARLALHRDGWSDSFDKLEKLIS